MEIDIVRVFSFFYAYVYITPTSENSYATVNSGQIEKKGKYNTTTYVGGKKR